MNNNRECIVCGEKYFYCFNQTCYDDQPSYMAIFHDENCRDIFNTLNMEYFDHITKNAAIKALKKCDLSVLSKESANPKIKNLVEEMLAEKTESAE